MGAEMDKISFGLKKLSESEGWHDCAIRYAKRFGLEHEVERDYKHYMKLGYDEKDAAFMSCYNWDICDIIGGRNASTV